MITAKSYFSGAGGMDYGICEAGIKIIQSYEIDPICCETLRNNFDHEICQADITQITVLDQPEADVYIGTFHVKSIRQLPICTGPEQATICSCIFSGMWHLHALKCM